MYSCFSFSPKSSSTTSSPASSYSSTGAMEIPTASSSARPMSPSSSCAYPSWPRRSSLSNSTSGSQSFEHANSFISDEDLFPLVFDEAETDSNASTHTSPSTSRSPSMCEPDRIVGVDHATCAAWMRELIAEEKAKKDQERERKRRARNSSGKKRRSSSKQTMSPILEAGE